jgi:hypothetical protein
MQVGAFVPIAIFVLVVNAVSIRLLLLWRRTRALPELCIGLGLFVISFAGLPLAGLSRSPQLFGTPLGGLVFTVGMTVVAGGIYLFFVFTWCVFRRESRWGRVTLWAAALTLASVAIGYGYISLTRTGIDQVHDGRHFGMMLISLLVGCFTWTAIESLLYYGLLRRRRAIGLADPVVVNRFLLWGLSASSLALLCAGILVCLSLGMLIVRDAIPLYGIAIGGMVSSVTWSLTFFSPGWYRRSVEARHAAAA